MRAASRAWACAVAACDKRQISRAAKAGSTSIAIGMWARQTTWLPGATDRNGKSLIDRRVVRPLAQERDDPVTQQKASSMPERMQPPTAAWLRIAQPW
jgi:hypothetical protein